MMEEQAKVQVVNRSAVKPQAGSLTNRDGAEAHEQRVSGQPMRARTKTYQHIQKGSTQHKEDIFAKSQRNLKSIGVQLTQD